MGEGDLKTKLNSGRDKSVSSVISHSIKDHHTVSVLGGPRAQRPAKQTSQNVLISEVSITHLSSSMTPPNSAPLLRFRKASTFDKSSMLLQSIVNWLVCQGIKVLAKDSSKSPITIRVALEEVEILYYISRFASVLVILLELCLRAVGLF